MTLTLAEIRTRIDALDEADLSALKAVLAGGVAQETFRDFVTRVRPGYRWYRHNAILADVLQRVADGELKRVMVFMPPRHGKSEEVSRLFTAYYLQRHPDRWVGLTSYTAELAYTLSRAARRNYLSGVGKLSQEASAVKEWETGHGGGLWAAGVGGSMTGKGFHFGIVDDPIKDAEEAASETIRAKHQEWWESTFATRAEPDAAIVVIQTRWNELDLSGYLLTREHEEPEHWHVVDYPAIAEPEDEPYYPPTCVVEADWRELGEALCPERFPLDVLEKIRNRGTYWFSALYQQRPRPREGGMFKRHWFPIVDAPHPLGRDVRWWDRAATDGDGDYTAGVLVRRAKDGNYYVLDVKRGQWASGERDRITKQTAREDGPHVAQWTEQEPGASGKDAALAFVRLLEGYGAHFIPASGTKELRADPLASAAEAGMVKLVKAPWNKAFLDELTAFPTGTHDDQVDACASAFNVLAKRPQISVDPDSMSVHQQSAWQVA